MISRLEEWNKQGFRAGGCGVNSVSFCEYINWNGICVVDITGHSCCATDKLLIDPTIGCAWYYKNLQRLLRVTIVRKTISYFGIMSIKKKSFGTKSLNGMCRLI